VLSSYAWTVGTAMQKAGTALREAQTTMPPPPPSVLMQDASANLLSETMAESDRQEAIQVVERLRSYYEVSVELMSNAEEPRFEPLSFAMGGFPDAGDSRPGSEQPGSTAQAPGQATTPMASGAEPASSTRGGAAPPAVGGGEVRPGQGLVTPQGPGVGSDGRVGTSLDSTGVISPDVVVPTGPPSPERGGGSMGSGPPTGGGNAATVPPGTPTSRVPGSPPAANGGVVPPRGATTRPVQPGGQPPVAGRPPTMGGGPGQMAPRSPVGGSGPGGSHGPVVGRPPMSGGGAGPAVPRGSTRSGPNASGTRPPTVTGVPTNNVQPPVAGRPPAVGDPGASGGPGGSGQGARRPPERQGIVGGIPRRTENPTRGDTRIPQGGVVSPNVVPVERSEVGRPVQDGEQPRRGLIGRRGQRSGSLGGSATGGGVTGRPSVAPTPTPEEGTYGQAVGDGKPRGSSDPQEGTLPKPQGVMGASRRGRRSKRNSRDTTGDSSNNNGQRQEGQTGT
jgi:hypothetical protein